MKISILTCVLFISLPITVLAGPADYIYTPIVEYGEREFDFKSGTASAQSGGSSQGASVGYGYGIKEYWFTEIYLKRERSGNTEVNLAEWENKFQLSETGEYPIDLGFVTELEGPLSGNAPWEINIGPLLQKEFGKFLLNSNLLFQHQFGYAAEGGIVYNTNLNYQWQVKYRLQPLLELGLQGFGEMGKWNDWNKQADQIHRVGPAIFGKFTLGNRQAIRYNAAWLIGASTAAPNHTFRMQIEYEF